MKRECQTCKYGGLRMTDAPCNACDWHSENASFNQWEPMDQYKEATTCNTLQSVAIDVVRVLNNSGLTWSMSYVPSTNSYGFYLSENAVVDPDE